jgi:hypothetical protein
MNSYAKAIAAKDELEEIERQIASHGHWYNCPVGLLKQLQPASDKFMRASAALADDPESVSEEHRAGLDQLRALFRGEKWNR